MRLQYDRNSNMSEQYRSSETLIYPLTADRALAYNTVNDVAMSLSTELARELAQFRSFRFLAAHEHARSELVEAISSHILSSRSEIFRWWRTNESKLPQAKVEVIGIATRNRPQLLDRCIRSYSQNARDTGRDVRFLVSDGAVDPNAVAVTRDVLRSLVRELRVEIAYSDVNSRLLYCDAFGRATGLDVSGLRFALAPESSNFVNTGSCRNALLLETLGSSFICVDDDTVCHPRRPSKAQGTLRLTSRYDPCRFDFPMNQEEIEAMAPKEAVDFVGLHESHLGRSIRSFAPSPSDEGIVDIESIDGLLMRLLRDGPEGRVAVTALGFVGDCGVSRFAPNLFLDSESQKGLISSRERFSCAVRTREVLRYVDRTTLSRGGFSIGINLGLCNRSTLPPFPPLYRSQDGVFGVLLRYCSADAYFCYLPWAIEHRPAQPRSFPPPVFTAADLRTSFAGFLFGLTQEQESISCATDADARLRELGSRLAQVGAMQDEDFARHVRSRLIRIRAANLREAEPRLNSPDIPDYYREALRSYVTALEQAIVSEDLITPEDVGLDSPPTARMTLQGEIRRFGTLLESWPSYLEAAREKPADDLQLFSPVARG